MSEGNNSFKKPGVVQTAFHFNSQTNKNSSVTVSKMENGNIILSVRVGVKGGDQVNNAISLNPGEALATARTIEEMVAQIVKKNIETGA